MSVSSEPWIRVTKKAFWHNTSLFAHGGYSFPDISFEYPADWFFECCRDMDHASEHLLCADEGCDTRYVSVTAYGLAGCPAQKPSCSLDEREPKTASQKYDELIDAVRRDSTALVLSAGYAPGLTMEVFRYERADHSRVHIIPLDTSIVEIVFSNSVVANEPIIDEFMSRITWDR